MGKQETDKTTGIWTASTETTGMRDSAEQRFRGVVKEGRRVIWRGEWRVYQGAAYEEARDRAVPHNLNLPVEG